MSERAFAARYRKALREFVEDRSERRLKTAYELGRAAVQSGLSVLDVAGDHTEALAALVRAQPGDADEIVEAGGDFLVESLAAFEMVQRGATEARLAAFQERRRARMLRELSSVLADASVASRALDSVGEVAQLVAEIAREATGAERARLALETDWLKRSVQATSEEPDPDAWSELPELTRREGPRRAGRSETVSRTLSGLDGRAVGVLEIEAPAGALRADDRATMTQIAEMTAAWLERAQRSS